MAKYDDASWHYGGDYPADLPNENASTHIGMFLAWCINNDLISDELREDATEKINNVKSRQMTGGEFLMQVCDEKLIDSDLSELGQQFANDYYADNMSEFAENFGGYMDDYCIFDEGETIYHVEDTWENYDIMAKILDERFVEWKDFTKNISPNKPLVSHSTAEKNTQKKSFWGRLFGK